MALLALGVVFGDIGTSPLYAFQTAVALTGATDATGVASLIVWTLFLVVAVKYVLLVMRADRAQHAAAVLRLMDAAGAAPISGRVAMMPAIA